MHYLFNRIWQNSLPQHSLSRLGGKLADCEHPRIKKILCELAIKSFDIDVHEAASTNLDDYRCFNDFFDRYLLPTCRPIDSDQHTIVSPADGVISECGAIEASQQTLTQAKNCSYPLADLINDSNLATEYQNGHYATIYLSPRDYHRVHAPLNGTLTHSEYVRGRLFAVNQTSVRSIKNLFCRNERLICHLHTALGRVIVVFVGALLVNGIRTQWLQNKPTEGVHTLDKEWTFKKGEELGLFRFGSTVIVIFPNDSVSAFSPQLGQTIKMGQPLAETIVSS